MSDTMPAPLRAAWESACAARDRAHAAPMTEPHALANEWRVHVNRIDDAHTASDKIAACQHAEAAMRRRAMPTPPPTNAVARRAARRREHFHGQVS